MSKSGVAVGHAMAALVLGLSVWGCSRPPREASDVPQPTANAPAETTDDDLVADVPLIDLQGVPMRVWHETLPDGRVGVIRVTGDAPGEVGERGRALLRAFASDKAQVAGFAGPGIADLREAKNAPAYAEKAGALIAAFEKLAEQNPRFVEMWPVESFGADLADVEDGEDAGARVVQRFRAPSLGPALVPVRDSKQGAVWLAPAKWEQALANDSVLTSAEDGPAWEQAVGLFVRRGFLDVGTDRTAFFRVRKGKRGFEVSCIHAFVGPYVETLDSKRDLVVARAPWSTAAGGEP
jgi:hypothetical protein